MSVATDWLTRPVLLPLGEHHLDQVLEIEQASYTYPWPREIFVNCMRHGYSCWALGCMESIDVYGIMSVSKAVQEAHVFNLCVRPSLLRRGLGRAMLYHLVELAEERGARTMLLEVRPSNTPALALYHSMRFKEVGRRPRYYRSCSGREDALLLLRELSRTRRPARLFMVPRPVRGVAKLAL